MSRAATRPQVIDFAAARDYVLPIGRYAGRTLADIGQTDRGLSYLAWILHARDHQAEVTSRKGSANERETTAMLRAYLTAPTVAAEVAALRRQPRHENPGAAPHRVFGELMGLVSVLDANEAALRDLRQWMGALDSSASSRPSPAKLSDVRGIDPSWTNVCTQLDALDHRLAVLESRPRIQRRLAKK